MENKKLRLEIVERFGYYNPVQSQPFQLVRCKYECEIRMKLRIRFVLEQIFCYKITVSIFVYFFLKINFML